jgi:PilZ domain
MKVRAASEDRAAHRRHIKQRTVAILRPGVEIECTVLDTSETGARLRFRGGVILPKKFAVHLADAGREIGVTVVWQKGTLAGVRYAERLAEPKARRGILRF